jgi:pilus assembly protein Flp/PilA
MNTSFPGRFLQLQNLLSCEEGQDLVEYALVVALLALGAVASMQVLASAISTEFTTISTTFAGAF